MTLRALLPRPRSAAGPLALLALVAAFALAACADDGGVPEAADVEDLRERPTEEQALYLAAFDIGEQIRQSDSTFNVDAFLRGFAAGFEADSALGTAYGFGYQQGVEFRSQTRVDSALSPDLSLFVAGFRQGFGGDERPLSEAEVAALQEEMQMRQLRRAAREDESAQAFLAQLETAKVSADSFLTAHATRDSVQTSQSGLQYVVLAEGTGESPQDGDRALVTYTLSLPDGSVLSTVEEPIDLEVGEMLIPGMNETLKSMRIGGHRRVVIPPALAYGAFGEPRLGVGPNTVLVFDVRLLDILDPIPEGTQAPGLSQPQVQPQVLPQQ